MKVKTRLEYSVEVAPKAKQFLVSLLLWLTGTVRARAALCARCVNDAGDHFKTAAVPD